MRTRLFKIFIIIFTLLFCNNYFASFAQVDANKIKAIWVHTLISYIKWKDDDKKTRSICTRGLNRTYKFLKAIQSNEDINFKLVEKGNRDDYKDCDLLYIATSESRNFESILNKVGPNIVTVSEIRDFAVNGGIIEIEQKRGSVGLKINIKAAMRHNVVINSDLLAVSKVISR